MEPSSWQILLDRLTKAVQLSGELLNYKNIQRNAERVTFCSKNTLVNDKLSEWMKLYEHTSTNRKDAKLALQLKMDGNKAYVKKDNKKSLLLYNKALLACPENEIALLYGNRSAVLFDYGLWEECIVDVNVALSKGFPHEKSWKLYKRKGEALWKLNRIDVCVVCFEKCVELLEGDEKLKKEQGKVTDLLHAVRNTDYLAVINKQTNDISIEESKLLPLHGFSKYVTSVSKALSLSQNDIEGRHFVANETIECGSIVIVEKPYASVLLPEWFGSRCQHCFAKVTYMFPCKQCTEVCYCSIECQDESWKSYHYFECGKLNIMEEIGVAHLALRIILVSDMKTLSMFFDDSEIKSQDIKGCNCNGVYESSYESLYHLMTHSEDLQVEDLFQYTVASLLLLNVLSHGDYFTINTTDYIKFQVGGLLLRHIQQIVCNAHAITSIESTSNISENIVEQDQVRIATALYATSSILNHSCSPNILNTFYKDKLIVKVIKRIKEGEHIYTCYGPHYRRMDFAARQNALKGQYFFHCKCEHCLKGMKAMEEFDCFLCPKCQQSVQIGNKTCLHCNASLDSFIHEYNEKSAQAIDMFSSGLELMNKKENNTEISNQTINLALSKLLNSLKIQEEIYFKFHSTLGKTFDAIAKCYAVLYNYPESIVYIKKSVMLVEAHYGDESAEVTNEYLKLCDVYFELMQNFIDNKDHTGIEKYYSEALSAVEKCIKLLELNKEPDSADLLDLKCKHESLIKLGYLDNISVRH